MSSCVPTKDPVALFSHIRLSDYMLHEGKGYYET